MNEEIKSEEQKIDYKAVYNSLKDKWHYLALIILFILIINVRGEITQLSITDNWANNAMNTYLGQQINAQITSQYPNLPDSNKQKLINEKLQEMYKTDGANIQAQIQSLSQEYKKMFSYTYNGKQYVFLGDLDSYYWLRQAENLDDHGNICESIKDGVCWDDLVLAPLGRENRATIHPYMMYYTHKILSAIGIDMPMMHVSLITPTIIALLVALFAFFLGYILIGKFGGILMAALISLNSMYISRSIGSDNDIYNFLIPLMVLTFLFMALKSDKNWKAILYSALSGVVIGCSKFAWESGWWNIFNAILFAFIGYFGFIIVHSIRIKKFQISNILKPLKIFSVFYIVGGVIFNIIAVARNTNLYEYFNAPLLTMNFIKFSKAASSTTAWPNVLNTVAEFSPLPLANIPAQIFSFQSLFLFALSLLGIFIFMIRAIKSNTIRYWIIGIMVVISMFLSKMLDISKITYLGLLFLSSLLILGYFFIKKEELENHHHYYIIAGLILSIWYVGTLYASTTGIRFALLAAMPACIAVAMAITLIYNEIIERAERANSFTYKISTILITSTFIVFLMFGFYGVGHSITSNFVPNYNIAWDTSLKNIKNDSQPDAIINSWWDFGHWFAYTSDRGVTLDGATQNKPPLHWLGKMLLTDNENVSRGVLRMLDCGSYKAFDILYNETNDTSKTIDLMNEIMLLDKSNAQKLLTDYGFKTDVLQYTHCDAPGNYLIVSDDMVGKAPVWAHFGSWDFDKAEVAALALAGKDGSEILKELGHNETEGIYNQFIMQPNKDSINAWISPWPQVMDTLSCNKNGTNINCEDILLYENNSCYFKTKDGNKHPTKCFVNQKIIHYKEDIFINQGREVGISFMNNNSMAVISDDELAGSMFFRLYYDNGIGLKNFELFDHQQIMIGTNIYTWKVKW